MIYLLIVVLLIFLSICYDSGKVTSNKKLWYRITLLLFILIAGLRWRVGGDTANYLNAFYENVPYLWIITLDDFIYSRQEPLFFLLNSFVKSLGCKFYVVQLIQATIVNALVFRYIKKHCPYLFSCLLLYFVWFYVFLNFEEMRAGISVAICLFANDYVLEKKLVKGLSLYILATMFHYSTIVLLFTPFLLFLKFDIKGILFLIFAIVFGYFVKLYIGDYLFLFEISEATSEKMKAFVDEERYFSQELNIFGVIGVIGPMLFYGIMSYLIIKKKSLKNKAYLNALQLQPFVILGLFWVLVSVFVPLAYRYIRFYQLYFAIYVTILLSDILFKNKIKGMQALCHWMILFVPMLWVLINLYIQPEPYTELRNYQKYIPYYSIFDRKISKDRENIYTYDKAYNKNNY